MENNRNINTEGQLVALLDLKNNQPFVFSFPEFTVEENKVWTERIKKNYFACGCNTGAIFMLLTITFLIIFFLYKNTLKHEIYYVDYFYGFIMVFLMSIVGKVIGKKISNFKLKKDIYQLQATLKMNYHQPCIGKTGQKC